MILVNQEKIDDFVAKGWWGRATLGGIFLDTAQELTSTFAVADPPNRAELFGGAPQHWSWAELMAQVGRFSALLDAQGVQKDDVIVPRLERWQRTTTRRLTE